ncbi:hypothetical protein F383_00621 [Gossypium arboreum]|uniref:Uncharacterized protein n=1 Tax=Gossypium arboreum TaxID=29729 RepID=A0A0B0N5G6_GOSAR|nr:hypothetical protein F383_35250 [Gossypium arboreum]KHG30018.1 hypothetical protein F383_00621 [Gossypium arboreum]
MTRPFVLRFCQIDTAVWSARVRRSRPC